MYESSINLNWQRRYRGLIPASDHSLAADGTAILVRSDPVVARTYQVLQLDTSGSETEVCAIAVETVRSFVPLPDGRMLLGMTADDIYIFREGKKTRFLPDRRVVYTDLALALTSETFVAAYSDGLFSTHGVAFAESSGRLIWHRDLPSQVNCVAINGSGKAVAIGLQTGRLYALDHRRGALWECVQDEPVTALAMGAEGYGVVAGTHSGTVFALDDEGGFRWRAAVGLSVTGIAVSHGFEWTAAVATDGAAHRLLCFDREGHPVWELDLEVKPTGVALSPSGGHLLLTFSNGGASLFEVHFASRQEAVNARLIDQAREANDEQGLVSAREGLLAALRRAPHRAEFAEELSAIEERLMAMLHGHADARREEGDLTGAFRSLQCALALRPWDPDLFTPCRAARNAAVTDLSQRAERAEEVRDWDVALELWIEALALDPLLTEARIALRQVRESQARDLTSQGDSRELLGDAVGAVTLWRQARELCSTPALEERLRTAEINRCMTAGIAFYEAERLPEAQFQFAKVLALDPDHAEAVRHLGYTHGRTEERSLISDRFSRLE